MASRFEDLEVWQAARLMHQATVSLCRRAEFRREFRLVDQMLAASRSVGANIAEGFDRFTPGEFAHSLYIAKGEVAELRTYLYCSLEEGRIQEPEFKALVAQTESLSRQVGALRAVVAKRKPAK
jgi:four helix bundle protein